MDVAAHVASLRADGERLAEAAEAAGLDAPVPTCAEWKVRDLVHHAGGVHRWATFYVTRGHDRPTTAEEDDQLFGVVADPELLPWFRDGHAGLVAALERADAGLRCWTFLPAAESPLHFWARRQAHETHIHRVDAEAAAGWPSGCQRDLGADGIDELLNGFLARRRGRLVSDPPLALGVRATDADAAWTIRVEPDRRVTTAGITNPDCLLQGPAGDLYHYLWNRLPIDSPAVEVTGDRRVVRLWRERATITWS
jgi:uncharacterized protein (TIGR03083 family)